MRCSDPALRQLRFIRRQSLADAPSQADHAGGTVGGIQQHCLDAFGAAAAGNLHAQTQVQATLNALLPATPFPATRIDESDPVALSRGNLTRFTRMFNLTGNPAIVLPCGQTADGLPIGLQIVGPYGSEHRILWLARSYEKVRGEFGFADL